VVARPVKDLRIPSRSTRNTRLELLYLNIGTRNVESPKYPPNRWVNSQHD
jgi:hypothetical protein